MGLSVKKYFSNKNVVLLLLLTIDFGNLTKICLLVSDFSVIAGILYMSVEKIRPTAQTKALTHHRTPVGLPRLCGSELRTQTTTFIFPYSVKSAPLT